MEEILASIRRIIEDSDGDAGAAANDARGRPAVDAARDKPVDAGEKAQPPAKPQSVVEVEAFRADLQARSQISASAPQSRSTAPANDGGSAAGLAAEPAAAGPDDVSARELRLEQAVVAQQRAPAADGFDPSDFSAEIDEDVIAELAASFALETDHVAAPGLEDKAAIVSERTGRQVAASFGELSEAFAASRRRGFDEVAEDLLRPMLRDWLDNNLPKLVERLVREEIERVARGAAA